MVADSSYSTFSDIKTKFARQNEAHVTAQASLTLGSQKVRVEAQKVCAEVEPALAGDFAFPVAAWVICDQLFLGRQLEPLLKPQKGFSEFLWIVLQHQRGLPFFSNKALKKNNIDALQKY